MSSPAQPDSFCPPRALPWPFKVPGESLARWGGFLTVLAAIAATAGHSYVLFHSLAEIVRIVVVFGIAALAWNARDHIDHPFLLIAGLAYPAVGVLELLHTLAYKGMGVFPGNDANLPTQLWIAGRAFEGVALLLAAASPARRSPPVPCLALAFLAAGALLGWTVFTGRFPDCFVEGQGLSEFKVNAEYVIAALFTGALLRLWWQRRDFPADILPLILLGLAWDILAELAFTRYVSVYGPANMVGHLLLLTSTYCLYRALLLQGIRKPQLLLFHQLYQDKEFLARSEARLAENVAERTAQLSAANLRLQEELATRARIEERLRENEEMLRLTRNGALDGVVVANEYGEVVVWNPAAVRLFGYREDEALGRKLHDLIVPEAGRQGARVGLERFRRSGSGPMVGRTSEATARRRDGSLFPVEISISAVLIRGAWHAVGIVRDITDRKAAIRTREQLAAIVDSTHEAIIGKNLDGIITSWNLGAERLYGYSAEEILGRSIARLAPPEKQEELAQLMVRVARGEIVQGLETERLTKDGTRLDVALTLSAITDRTGAMTGIATVAHDITARKAAERALRRLNRRLKLLSASNQTLLHGTGEDDLLNRMTRVVTEVGGFTTAWVGRVDRERGHSLQLLAVSPPALAEAFAATCQAMEPGTPVAEVFLGGRPVIFRDQTPLPGLPAAAAGIVLPLAVLGQAMGDVCLVMTADDPALVDKEEVATLEELAADLSFGLNGLAIKAEREKSLEFQARTMEDAIRAIAASVEMRDPYTAGHQRRVAELSGAIARELGLPPDRVHGIQLAAMIHDLGKINIPAEILSKPGRLSDIEYALIMSHPAVGYEIIKDIAFPWPIAKAMLQHHERLDGSGYPAGLKGKEILLEARIIGAADLVEAMSSHRPYRPGFGIEAALAELETGRGTTFDAEVVDACLRLFREKGFQLPAQWGNGR